MKQAMFTADSRVIEQMMLRIAELKQLAKKLEEENKRLRAFVQRPMCEIYEDVVRDREVGQ